MPVLSLADGRQLAYALYGDPAGRPALYCHGFPTSHQEARLVDGEARRRGLRVAAPDRPGYGGSTAAALANVAHWTGDVEELLDALGWRRVAVIGVSGGGPYALACGACLPRRVTAVVLVGPLGPVGEPAVRAAMRGFARLGFLLAARAPAVLAAFFGLLRRLLAGHPSRLGRALSLVAPAADRRVLARAEVQQVLLDGVQEALADGGGAAAAELGRYARPWGFELARVVCPVLLWHGEADRVVPVSHGRRLAAGLPRVTVRLLSGEGHYSVPVAHTAAIMAALDHLLDTLEAGGERRDTA